MRFGIASWASILNRERLIYYRILHFWVMAPQVGALDALKSWIVYAYLVTIL